MGVIFIFKNDKGEEVARVALPPGGTVEVQGEPAAGSGRQAARPGNSAKTSGATGSASAPPAPLVAPFDAAAARAGQAAWARHLGRSVEEKNPAGMTLVLIPPGEFLMGSTPEQSALGRKMAEDVKLKPDDYAWARLKEEGPQHRVAITKPYWLGMTEVSIGQFKKFVEATKYVTQAEEFGFGNSNLKTSDATVKPEQKKTTWRAPGYAVTDESPVTQVTWNDAVQFCNWLSDHEKLKPCYRQDTIKRWVLLPSGTGYRLPTEAEWEYACRAGTTTQFSFGDDPAMLDIYGWFNKNSGGSARAAGLKVANAFDLFDVHGGAYEWCHDFYAGDYYSKSSPADPWGPSFGSSRVIRGGAWGHNPVYCRSASRHGYALGSSYYGFRVLRVSLNVVPPVVVASSNPPSPLAGDKQGVSGPEPWNTPAFQQWVKATQALPAEQQIEAVSKKLMELNPGFDGMLAGFDPRGKPHEKPKVEDNHVTEIGLFNDHVSDLSPVRALPKLQQLACYGSVANKRGMLSDLSPLSGMSLTKLNCSDSQVADLSPLEGMPLTWFACGATNVSDLSPLKGMQLKTLHCSITAVRDLSPLEGMPITDLGIHETPVSDLSPLTKLPKLDKVNVRGTKVTPAGVAALQKALPNCKIEWDDPAKPKTPEPAAAGSK